MATNMNVKAGTKTWADKPAQAPQDINDINNLTPAQKKQVGEEDMGALLNKVADPNYVDGSKKVKGTGSNNLDKDAFFKLMLTQLKNQDPTNPLKNHEMAAQLAQFSTLEQMSNMNTTLTKIEGKNSKPEDFQALNLIGKTVAGDSSRVVRSQFDNNHDFNFNLPQDANAAKVKVLNEKNEVVREYNLSNLKSGANKISWNGMDTKGDKQNVGEYQFQIEATSAEGKKVQVKSDFQGVITGLSFSKEGPVLQVGNQTIKMRDVRQITDGSLKNNDQNVKDVTNLDLKKTDDVAQTGNKQNEEANTSNMPKPEEATKATPVNNVMTDVAMSRDLMEKLQKAQK